MPERFAFTAKYWGHAAVVCRAGEDRSGPVVEQQFGEFETWTQARMFAARLNEGLEIQPGEVQQIVTSAILHTNDVLGEIDVPERARNRGCALEIARSVRVRFLLAELDLAVTFCRIVRTKPSRHTERLLRNARNALFNAMHYVLHSEPPERELLEFSVRLQNLQAALESTPVKSELAEDKILNPT
jgi:hypothetical protein